MENSMEAPYKLRIDPPYDPAILFLGIYPKNTKTLIQKDTCAPLFIAALCTVVEIQKQPKCPPVDEWIEKNVKTQWTTTQP